MSTLANNTHRFRLIRNMSGTESILRIVAGAAILGVGAYLGSWWGLIGLVPILTGSLGYCPVYSLFRRNGHS